MKCTICGKEAVYVIKGTTTGYCDAHARQCFADTSYLATIEQEAQRLQDVVDDN